MEKIRILHKKAMKLYSIPSKDEIEKKTSQQQGESRARVRLEQLKNKFINLLMRSGEKSKAYKLFAESLNILQETSFSKLNEKSGQSLCENRAELFQLYTEKNKNVSIPFQEQQEPQKPYNLFLSKDNKNVIFKKDLIDSKAKKFIPSYLEQNYYNDFLKNNTLYQAVENIKPTLELRRVRKGGTTYQVPAIVNQKRQERLAIKWIIESAEKRKKKNKSSFSDCLVSEILEAFNKTGQPRQRRDEQLKIAEFNRAYTRYRWW